MAIGGATPQGSLRFYRPIAMVSAGGSCIGALLLSVTSPSPRTLGGLAATLALAALGWWATRPACLRGSARNWILALSALSAFLLWPELGLRLAAFHHEAGIEFLYPNRSDFVRFARDPYLFWTYPPNQPGVNSLGFHDEEHAVPKPDGVFRILFLGDSCTDFGEPNYPKRIEKKEQQHRPAGRRVEAVVMAVAAYSSYQGRVMAERYGRRFEPDAVVVYFGWNDHWQALGEPDHLRRGQGAETTSQQMFEWISERWRFLQFGRKVEDVLMRTGRHTPHDIVRVPIDEYRNNLDAIRRVFLESGVPVVFITAPTSWYRLGVPQRLVELGYVPDAPTAIQRHRRYNEVVRQVAALDGALLLDLEREFESGAATDESDPLMTRDGIHFTSRGFDFVAERTGAFLDERFALSRTGRHPAGGGAGTAPPFTR